MAQKIIISKPGYNALTETDPRNLIFSSDLNHLKTVAGGSFQQDVAGFGNETITLAHGLGYKPLALCYFNISTDSKWFISMSTLGFETRYSVNQNVEISTDDTYVYFVCRNPVAGTKTFNVQYEVFYEGNS